LHATKTGDTGEDDEAWEGKDDPFVHLSADERQLAMKEMNMRQIELAGNQRLLKSKRESWLRRMIPTRRSFRKPRNL
jgi:hypothetical protein